MPPPVETPLVADRFSGRVVYSVGNIRVCWDNSIRTWTEIYDIVVHFDPIYRSNFLAKVTEGNNHTV